MNWSKRCHVPGWRNSTSRGHWRPIWSSRALVTADRVKTMAWLCSLTVCVPVCAGRGPAVMPARMAMPSVNSHVRTFVQLLQITFAYLMAHYHLNNQSLMIWHKNKNWVWTFLKIMKTSDWFISNQFLPWIYSLNWRIHLQTDFLTIH